MVRISSLLIGALLAAATTQAAAAAVLDVTGYWKSSADKSIALDVERQFNTFKIGIVEGTTGKLAVSFAVSPDQRGNGFSATAYVEGKSGEGLRRGGGGNVNVGPVQVVFADEAHGTLIWKGHTFPLTRDEFVSSGLAAPIDPSGPETGWYAAAAGALAFVENQGASTKVTQIDGLGRVGVSVVAKTAVVAANGLAGLSFNGKPYARQDFEDPATPVPFAGDTSAYSLPRATEAQIVTLPGAASMRLRSAMREKAAAYLAYFASPTSDAAVATTTRDLTAYQCVRDLTTLSLDTATIGLDKIIFDSLTKANLYLQLQTQLGTSVIADQGVSASAPNACSLFMQGLARQFAQSTASSSGKTGVRGPASEEQLHARADARSKRARIFGKTFSPAAAATTTSFGVTQSCNKDEYIFLSGVGTNAMDAKKQADEMGRIVAASQNVPVGSILVKAISNPNPGFIFNVSQVLLDRFHVSQQDVILFKVDSFSIFAAIGNFESAAMSYLVSEYARAAIVTSASASQSIASTIGADVASGYRTLLIPHSQGNILTNRGVEALDADTLSHVGLTGVASADNHVPGNGSLGIPVSATRDDDRVINALRLVRGDTLPATIHNAGAPEEFFRHLFIESYLENPAARHFVLGGLGAAMRKAKFPSTQITLGVDAGGFTGPSGQQQSFGIGRDVTEIDVDYNMYTIPDAMDVLFRGKRVATTGGPVSYTGTLHAKLPIAADDHSEETLDVIVYGTDPGTAWNYSVLCPMPKS